MAQKREGHLAEAIEAYRASLALAPAQPATWANLGRALREARDGRGAVDAFRQAIVHDPQRAEAHSMLSNALREQGAAEEALACARRAMTLTPKLAEAHLNEGAALHALGRIAEAAVSYVVAGALGAQKAAAQNLDIARRALNGKPVPAELELALGLTGKPTDADLLSQLASQLLALGRLPSAAACLHVAESLKPSAQNLLLLAFIERHSGRTGLAEALLRAAIEREPCHIGCLSSLGASLLHEGRVTEARPFMERAVAEQPESPELQLNLANILRELGEHEACLARCDEAIRLAPDRPELHSVRLFSMHSAGSFTLEQLREAHIAYGARFGGSREFVGERDKTPDRRLRVGYVSSDFCAHAASHFVEPLLRAHDASQVEVFVYSDVRMEDAVTERIRAVAPNFRVTALLDDAELAALVRADTIDILVDLNGHSAAGRLPAFAEKPAPVQVSAIGYFDTTGVPAIDYRIGDAHAIPAGNERYFTEEVVRLPRSANCFQPIVPSPAVAPAPFLEHGYVTFGCFNQPGKLSRDYVRALGAILRGSPRSRLVFKYAGFGDEGLCEHTRRRFAEERIDPRRLSFRGHSPVPSFLKSFAEIDVALDPFPYGGETTALHTLWMGVPVIALEGASLAGRLGSRVLRAAGLDAWVAGSVEEYVAKAVAAAADAEATVALRGSLRDTLLRSPLLDHVGVTRELEAAYRAMWQRFCAP